MQVFVIDMAYFNDVAVLLDGWVGFKVADLLFLVGALKPAARRSNCTADAHGGVITRTHIDGPRARLDVKLRARL